MCERGVGTVVDVFPVVAGGGVFAPDLVWRCKISLLCSICDVPGVDFIPWISAVMCIVVAVAMCV